MKARLVARQTTRLTPEAAGVVETHVAPTAHQVRPAQLARLVNEVIGRHIPEEVERLAEALHFFGPNGTSPSTTSWSPSPAP